MARNLRSSWTTLPRLARGSALAMFCALAACGGAADEDSAASEDAIVGGTTSNDHPAIGKVDMGNSFCTGTLVTSRIVLTAAHCFGYVTDSRIRGTAFVIPGSDGDFRYAADRVHSFGKWSAANEPGWRVRDVAILRLARAVPARVARPIGLAPSAARNGAKVAAWGYGCTNRTSKVGAGTKRKVEFLYGSGFRAGTTDRQHLCPGDSGGPLLDVGRGLVVGVNSGYINDVDYYGSVPTVYQDVFDKIGAFTP